MRNTKTNKKIGNDSSVSHHNQDTTDGCDVSSGVNFSIVSTPVFPEPVIVRIRDPRRDVVTVRSPGVNSSIVSTPTLPEPIVMFIQNPRSTLTTVPSSNIRRSHRSLKKIIF